MTPEGISDSLIMGDVFWNDLFWNCIVAAGGVVLEKSLSLLLQSSAPEVKGKEHKYSQVLLFLLRIVVIFNKLKSQCK